MKTKTRRKETSTLTVESFINDMEISSTEPVRIECGITSDYSIFKRFPANRLLNGKRAEQIGKDMSRTGNFSTVDCVRQGNYLLVWDGQHVLEAARIAGKHVNYNVWDKVPKSILREKNKNTKQWTLEAYHESYLEENDRTAKIVDNFVKLSKSMLGRPIKLTATLRLLSGKYSNEEYKNGTYEVLTPANAQSILKCLRDFSEYIDFAPDSKFATSFQQVYNCGLYNHKVMLKRLPKNYKLLHSQLKVIDIVTGIEDCYNKRSRGAYVDFVSACDLKRK